jgi:shikimate 5-dehydrogenase
MEKYGLIGYPLRHSFSIGYFNEKFKSEGINAEYVNFEIPQINDFMEVIEENPNLRGLNVTIPYKEQVIPFLNELDPDTAKIGAVNVIKIIRQQKGKVKLIGYNSDIIGFTVITGSSQESVNSGNRRCFQSCLPRTQKPGNRKCFRFAYSQSGRNAYLRGADS